MHSIIASTPALLFVVTDTPQRVGSETLSTLVPTWMSSPTTTLSTSWASSPLRWSARCASLLSKFGSSCNNLHQLLQPKGEARQHRLLSARRLQLKRRQRSAFEQTWRNHLPTLALLERAVRQPPLAGSDSRRQAHNRAPSLPLLRARGSLCCQVTSSRRLRRSSVTRHRVGSVECATGAEDCRAVASLSSKLLQQSRCTLEFLSYRCCMHMHVSRLVYKGGLWFPPGSVLFHAFLERRLGRCLCLVEKIGGHVKVLAASLGADPCHLELKVLVLVVVVDEVDALPLASLGTSQKLTFAQPP